MIWLRLNLVMERVADVVWAICPAAINNMQVIHQGIVKFQVGETFDLTSQISLGHWTLLYSETTQMAIMTLGYSHSQESQYDSYWGNPRLDSTTGAHNRSPFSDPFWVIVDFAGNLHYVHQLLMRKRGDGICLDWVIS